MNLPTHADNSILALWFENYYECSECNEKWTDEWSCMCNDRCPNCDIETEPTSSIDLSRPLTKEDYVGATRLITGNGANVTDEDARDYAEAMLEGGEYRFTVRRA